MGKLSFEDGEKVLQCVDCGAFVVVKRREQTCTRQAPHVCTVNGPCNGFPAAEGLNGRMPTVL